jgi:DNA-binding MarR family transcriptional regulator
VSEAKLARGQPLAAPSPLFLRDEELTHAIELLEVAYRGLMQDCDRVLAGSGLGSNHRRILHRVGSDPGVTMADLRGALSLSKQSLSRLLNELVAKDLITRGRDQRDRRQRPLRLTERGLALNEELNVRLRRHLAGAYRAAGADAVAGHHKVLSGLVDERASRHLLGAR